MNKEELKERISDIPAELSMKGILTGQTEEVISKVLELIDQLDEPEKPVIPSFVAEWIEKCKERNRTLSQAYSGLNDETLNAIKWLYHEGDRNGKVNLFARAWLDGYTVEEKTYRVKLGKAYIGEFSGIGNIVFDKKDAFVYATKEYAEGTAEVTGGTVEEVTK